MQKFQKDFIELAIFAGALKFGSFQLKSGRESPYYFNSGVFYTGEFTRGLADVFAQKINQTIKPDRYDIVFGPSYKGIPLAVSVSIALAAKGVNKPWCFNRKEAKGHGDGGVFVGAPVKDGSRLIILDDVFTTGGAKEEAIGQLKSVAKIDVPAVFILLDRQEKDDKGGNAIVAFEKKHGTKVHSVITASDVFSYLREEGKKKGIAGDDAIGAFEEYKKKYGI
jgi:orotate phosphoribosyltransferase